MQRAPYFNIIYHYRSETMNDYYFQQIWFSSRKSRGKYMNNFLIMDSDFNNPDQYSYFNFIT